MRKGVVVLGVVVVAGLSIAVYSHGTASADKDLKTVAVVRGPITE